MPASDVEAASPRPSRKRLSPRSAQFLLFGGVSFMWLGALLFIMKDVRTEHTRIEENIDYRGGDIEARYGIDSAEECGRACAEHPRCLVFTFVKSESACWLKGEGFKSKSNPNTISGTVNSSLAATHRAAFRDAAIQPALPEDGGDDEGAERGADPWEANPWEDKDREGREYAVGSSRRGRAWGEEEGEEVGMGEDGTMLGGAQGHAWCTPTPCTSHAAHS